MFKTIATDSVANRFIDKDVGTGTPGTRIEAADQNIKQDEIVNAVESSGQTLDPTGADAEQLARAMAIYGAGGGAFYDDTGVVNAHVLTVVSPKVVIDAYFHGMMIIFKPLVVNTGASTVNVNGLGVVDLVTSDGVALVGGETKGVISAIYNEATSDFEILSIQLDSYRRDNILDTVSQVGGVPTGAIIESGSNVNGEYTKFADGTMIGLCRGTELTLTTPSGSVFYENKTLTFPVTFSSVPVASNIATFGTGVSWAGYGASNITITAVSVRCITSVSGSTATPQSMVIGRWFELI